MIEHEYSIPLEQFRRALDKIENEVGDGATLSFEFFMASFFPDIFTNIQNELKRQYTLGYMSRIQEEKEESNDN